MRKKHAVRLGDGTEVQVSFSSNMGDLKDVLTPRRKKPRSKSRVEVYGGWTREELEAAFNAVQNPTHWKDPIHAWVANAEVEVTLDAIGFYTGTAGLITRIADDRRSKFIEADGYRAGPAGDH